MLFSTNLIGIVIAATITFRILGFSPAVQDKRRFSVVVAFLTIISIPLFLSYKDISTANTLEKSWKKERFTVTG